MILTASFSFLTEPMCQPPRHRMETFWPVLPSARVGRPFSASAASAAGLRPRAAPAASEAERKSRRSLDWDMVNSLVWRRDRASWRGVGVIVRRRRGDGQRDSGAPRSLLFRLDRLAGFLEELLVVVLLPFG